MEPPVNNIKVSQGAKDQLIKLKRITKIDRWNILCRWGFCYSLAETTQPAIVPIPADSNLEMTWDVFGGEIGDVLILALKQRCSRDGLGTEPETLAQQFRLHLHRGIGYLSASRDLKSIEDFVNLVSKSRF